MKTNSKFLKRQDVPIEVIDAGEGFVHNKNLFIKTDDKTNRQGVEINSGKTRTMPPLITVTKAVVEPIVYADYGKRKYPLMEAGTILANNHGDLLMFVKNPNTRPCIGCHYHHPELEADKRCDALLRPVADHFPEWPETTCIDYAGLGYAIFKKVGRMATITVEETRSWQNP